VILILVAATSFVIFQIHRKHQSEQLKQKLNEKREEISRAVTSFRSLINSKFYISKGEYSNWCAGWDYLRSLVQKYSKKHIETGFTEELEELESAFENGDSLINEKNEEYIQLELEKYQDFFDNIESHPLTESQRRTIVTDEKHNLIVAGAGTGKTSTIVGKAGYVLQKELAKPHEILLVCFARKARDEIEERVLARLGQKLNVETFHSLGLKIIADVDKSKSSVSELSTDRLKLPKAILGYIQKRSRDKEFLGKLNEYFAFHRTPYESEFNFKSKGEYIDFLRNNQVRSLKGHLVKSLEECDIANFLYINGIDYVYEGNYEVKTASKSHRQYKPDFHLPEYGIYIEHFGVDRNNETAPFVDRKKYLADMAWKRRIHRENNTTLVETYSWEKHEGVLLEKLERNLVSAGVKFVRIPPEQIFDKINELGLVHPFTRLLATFLNLFKSSRKSIHELLEQSKELPDYMRYKAFIEIFSEIYRDYEEDLGEEIDFNDMINKAEKYLTNGLYRSKSRYILVDEFQDISYNRFRLLKALLDQDPSAKLFCVGDDWQSIYRFTGSDISIMTDFNRHFDPSERLNLDKTFRFDNKLCDFSTKFILRNPNQIKKQLISEEESIDPSVTLLWSENIDDAISEVLRRIESSEEKGAQVFIIGRYNHQRPTNLSHLRKEYPKLSISYITAHSSKGKELDYVIVIGLTSQGYAFPSQIEDDPVLDLVLAKKELIPNAEERRLFYVAVTRAKKHVYLIASKNNPSTFASEIERSDYEVVIEERRGEIDVPCPECKTGFMVLRQGELGNFYSCNNYPYCEYKPHMCPHCGKGFLFESPGTHNFTRFVRYCICSNADCSFKREKCPRCKDGYLTVRSGRYSKFLGCSNYPACTYTKSLARA